MQFRDWPATLAPASYRGAHFYVEHDEIETGRRLVVHEFPHKDEPYVEDLGRDANKVTVTAYVVGDDADGQERALRSACEAGGPAMLVLPIDRMLAHCELAKRDFKKDKLGHIAFQLKFVRHGTNFGPFPVGWVASMLGGAAAAILAPLSALFAAAYQTVGPARATAEAAAGVVADIGLTLTAVTQSLPMDASQAPAVIRAAAGIVADAETLATVGETGHVWGDRSFLLASESLLGASAAHTAAAPATNGAAASDVVPVVARVAAVLEAMAAAAAPVDLARELAPLVAYTPPAAVAGQAPSWFREQANIAALAQAVRVAALARWVEAVAGQTYTDRRAAIQARADVAEAIESELSVLDGPGAHGLAVALSDLRGRAVELITRRIADLAPVLALEAGREMPSLWWANRLYGDASRAGEIARLNRVKHPSFMPRQIEALSR